MRKWKKGGKASVVVLALDPPQIEGQVVVGPECFLIDRDFLVYARQMLEYRWWDLEGADSIELWGEGKRLKVVEGE